MYSQAVLGVRPLLRWRTVITCITLTGCLQDRDLPPPPIESAGGGGGTGTRVGDVLFAGMPPCGEFTVFVVNVDGRAAGPFDLEVDGVVNENFGGTLEASAGSTSMSFNSTTCGGA